MESSPDEAGVQITIRLTKKLLERADALVVWMRGRPPEGVTRVNRSTVLRVALERGLDSLEAEKDASELPLPAKGGK